MLRKSIFVIFFILIAAILILKNSFVNASFSDTSSETNEINTAEIQPVADINSAIKIVSKSVLERDELTLEKYVTNVPKSYKEKYYEALRRDSKMDLDSFKKQMTIKPGTIQVNPFRTSSNKKDQVDFAINLMGDISDRNLKFIKIKNIKQYENEAKASIVAGYSDKSDLVYEVLLYRVNDEWKFFSFGQESLDSDLYAEENVVIPQEVVEQVKARYPEDNF